VALFGNVIMYKDLEENLYEALIIIIQSKIILIIYPFVED